MYHTAESVSSNEQNIVHSCGMVDKLLLNNGYTSKVIRNIREKGKKRKNCKKKRDGLRNQQGTYSAEPLFVSSISYLLAPVASTYLLVLALIRLSHPIIASPAPICQPQPQLLFVSPSSNSFAPAPIRLPQPIFACPSHYSLAPAPICEPQLLFVSPVPKSNNTQPQYPLSNRLAPQSQRKLKTPKFKNSAVGLKFRKILQGGTTHLSSGAIAPCLIAGYVPVC